MPPPEDFTLAEDAKPDPSVVLTQKDYDLQHRADYRFPTSQTGLAFSQSDYERFRAFALEKMGLDYPEERRSLLARGLTEVMALTGCVDLDQLYALLIGSSSTSKIWEQLISVLTIGETYFFRNANHFDVLSQHILPELVHEREHFNRRIRIWCAGCATGEEPYSIAITLRELIPQIESWNILILATDLNRQALAKAQAGLYSSWSFRGVAKRIQEAYFKMTSDKQYAIADEIKRMVTFEYLNLVVDPFPSLANNTNAMDIIFCRNVTIYFTAAVTQKVICEFFQCLVNGGWLIPGPSEPNMIFYNDYAPRNFPGAFVYQKIESPSEKSVPVFKPSVAPNISKEPLIAKPAVKPVPQPTLDPYRAALELMRQGQVDAALVKLYQKLDINPEFAPTYYALAKIYANKGNLEEAQHWCEQAIQKDKLHPEPYYTLSMVYQQHGLLDMALEMLKKTIYLDRNFVLAHYNLGQIYQRQGESAAARKYLQNVRQLLQGKDKNDLVAEGDGMVVGRLLELVESELEQKVQLP